MAASTHQAVTTRAVNPKGKAPGARRRRQASKPSQAVGAAANNSKTGTQMVGVPKAADVRLRSVKIVAFG